MDIFLKEIFPIADVKEFKIHFARYNKYSHPLDAWVQDKGQWQKWQEYRPKRNDFNRSYIFSLMQFHHEIDTWLFGGVFEVEARLKKKYRVSLTNIGAEFIGRLKIQSPYRKRYPRVRMEKHYNDFIVKEILPQSYTGRAFPGFQEIDLSFQELESLVEIGSRDWKAALENIKGVYLLTDTKTKKKYVGSAYGKFGIWARWENYVRTKTGGNIGISDLIKRRGIKYYKDHFRFALLEHMSFNTPNEKIMDRERYWKEILITRKSHGLNRN